MLVVALLAMVTVVVAVVQECGARSKRVNLQIDKETEDNCGGRA